MQLTYREKGNSCVTCSLIWAASEKNFAVNSENAVTSGLQLFPHYSLQSMLSNKERLVQLIFSNVVSLHSIFVRHFLQRITF